MKKELEYFQQQSVITQDIISTRNIQINESENQAAYLKKELVTHDLKMKQLD